MPPDRCVAVNAKTKRASALVQQRSRAGRSTTHGAARGAGQIAGRAERAAFHAARLPAEDRADRYQNGSEPVDETEGGRTCESGAYWFTTLLKSGAVNPCEL